jgi:hypothetical protein
MNSSAGNGWPTGLDGEVFRRLHLQGFEFSKEYPIEFIVDFASWPPPSGVTSRLQESFPAAAISENEDGYLLVTLNSKLTFEFVVEMQARLTEIARPFDGVCESWGVLYD